MMDTYGIATTLTNETREYNFSDFDEVLDPYLLTDDGKPDFGAIYRLAQQEYGRCQSSVYIDTPNGPKRIGWFFVSRQQYEDTGETYLRGAWVTVYKVTAPAEIEQREYVGL